MDKGDLTCLLISLAFGLVLMGSYFLGQIVRPKLPREHRSREMTEMLLSVTAMLVTFSAIVLGLMLNTSLNKRSI